MVRAKSNTLILWLGAEKFLFLFCFVFCLFVCFLVEQSWKLSVILTTKDYIKTDWHLDRMKELKGFENWKLKKNEILIFIIVYDFLVMVTPITALLHRHQSM